MPPVTLVLDTNIVLDWLVFEDPSAAALAHAIATDVAQPVTSRECLEELERVLAYDAFRLAPEKRAAILARYRERARVFAGALESPPGLPRCTDPDDQKFLELAWIAGADYLVTKDRALLALAKRVARLGRLRIVPPGGVAFMA